MKSLNNTNYLGTHSAPTTIFVLILFLIMWVIGGFSTDNWDWINYERWFNSQREVDASITLDIGYAFINNIANSSGMSFIQFRKILYFIYYGFICYIALKYCRKPALAVFLFFSLFCLRESILMRNTCATLFLYIGLFCLISKDIKHNKILFAVFNSIAVLFHASFVYYYLFLLCDRKLNVKVIFLISIILSLFGHVILSSIVSLEFFMDNDMMLNKAGNYLNNSSIWAVVICGFTYLADYIVVKRYEKECSVTDGTTNSDAHLITNITVLIMPLLMFNSINMEFWRLNTNLFYFLIIYCLNQRSSSQLTKIMFVLLVAYHFFWHVTMSGVGKQIGLILDSNLLI